MPACPRCSSEVSLAQRFCPSCGTALPQSSQTGTVAMPALAYAPASRPSSISVDSGRWAQGTVLAQRYRVGGRLGRGGMGEVYQAYDLILAQDVALKFLPANFATSEAALERFRNEVRLARQVSHPNVCRVYDIGEVDGAPFLSMEYVDGEDLASLLRRIGRLPSDKALDISRRLCAGLAAAHEKGVLHRDLKPGNVMIDGRGEVRITDFGLAALSGSITGPEARQGTPAYMAPEQLAGREVTPRSDIYSLGLVMYEMFTGKRAFEAASTAELARMQQESTPASILSFAKDVDPAVERAILRCLAPEPRNRPPSAKAVGLALPGGDPLAAAIAAGETPSPEMVANAGEGEGLRPGIAAAMLASVVVGAILLVVVSSAGSLIEKTPFEYSPEAMAAMARGQARDLGYAQRPHESAVGLESAADYLAYARSHIPSARLLALTAAGRPGPMTFWYRQSPGLLDPGAEERYVSMRRPGLDQSGMYRIRLDLEGRLLLFEAAPRELETASAPPHAPDWKPLWTLAGLDPAKFQPADPQWTPAMACDTRAAWTGALPEAPEIPIRLEAAGWRGKIVSFRIVEPWTKPERDLGPPVNWTDFGFTVLEVFILLPVGALLAWRNVRLKRGDQAGAWRLGVGLLAVYSAAALLEMHHVAGGPEALRLVMALAFCLLNGVFGGVMYLAVEPYVRRRYPHLLVSWQRLVQGNWRDPLLAGNVLAGLGIGLGAWGSIGLGVLLKLRLGVAPELSSDWSAILSPRQFLGNAADSLAGGLYVALFLVGLFFLFRVALRKDILAAAAVVAIGVGLDVPTMTHVSIDAPVFLIVWSLGMVALLRFGIPGVIAFIAVLALPPEVLTLDPSRWYFGYSLAYLLAVIAVAVCAFRFSLGGRKLLRDETLA